MKRRLITSKGPIITIPQIPDSLIEIVKIPKAALSPINRKRVDIYEAVMKFQLFGERLDGTRSWSEIVACPQTMIDHWRRCESCQRVLMIRSNGLSDSCTRCQKIELTLAMWGE